MMSALLFVHGAALVLLTYGWYTREMIEYWASGNSTLGGLVSSDSSTGRLNEDPFYAWSLESLALRGLVYFFAGWYMK